MRVEKARTVVLVILALGACRRSGAKPDREFDVSVATPAYASDGPVVLIDEAHHNIHTAAGTYAPFAELIRNDGYQVRRGRDRISASALAGVDIDDIEPEEPPSPSSSRDVRRRTLARWIGMHIRTEFPVNQRVVPAQEAVSRRMLNSEAHG